jgi:hypothetical protein
MAKQSFDVSGNRLDEAERNYHAELERARKELSANILRARAELDEAEAAHRTQLADAEREYRTEVERARARLNDVEQAKGKTRPSD